MYEPVYFFISPFLPLSKTSKQRGRERSSLLSLKTSRRRRKGDGGRRCSGAVVGHSAAASELFFLKTFYINGFVSLSSSQIRGLISRKKTYKKSTSTKKRFGLKWETTLSRLCDSGLCGFRAFPFKLITLPFFDSETE